MSAAAGSGMATRALGLYRSCTAMQSQLAKLHGRMLAKVRKRLASSGPDHTALLASVFPQLVSAGGAGASVEQLGGRLYARVGAERMPVYRARTPAVYNALIRALGVVGAHKSMIGMRCSVFFHNPMR